MVRRLTYLAVLVYALAVLGALAAPSGDSAEGSGQPQSAVASTSDAAPAPVPLPPPRPIIGFAINLHHTDRIELYLQAIDDMARMGFNTVEVLTPTFQRDGAGEEINVDVGPGKSPDRAQLVTVLKYAKQRGLTTVLMPLVLLANPRGNEWRGKILPEHWDVWWKSYTRNIDYFMGIANETGVSIFSVGSELLSTEEKQTPQWDALIKHVRQGFAGKLSYSTNWDHYQKPTFWSRLDMIGINGYWDLTEGAKSNPPSSADLVKRWKGIRKDVLSWGAYKNKPVLLTEIGYPSLPWGLKDPWNYVNTSDRVSTPEVQQAGFQAFLSVWKDMLAAPDSTQFMGVCFFEWDVYHEGGPDDTGYGIRGKPAYNLLKNWLASRAAGLKQEKLTTEAQRHRERGAERRRRIKRELNHDDTTARRKIKALLCCAWGVQNRAGSSAQPRHPDKPLLSTPLSI